MEKGGGMIDPFRGSLSVWTEVETFYLNRLDTTDEVSEFPSWATDSLFELPPFTRITLVLLLYSSTLLVFMAFNSPTSSCTLLLSLLFSCTSV